MRLLFTFILCFVLPTFAHASCGCSLIPNAGSYGGPGVSMKVSHIDGDAENCPTQIRIEAQGQDRPPIDVILTCEAGVYKGREPSPFGGDFEWIIAPKGGSATSKIPQGLEMSSEINVTLKLPPKLKAIGKKDRSFEMTEGGNNKAAPCLCTEVRAELAFAKVMLKSFEDKGLLQKAAQQNLRGKKSRANTALTPDGILRRFESHSKLRKAYVDIVQDKADQMWANENGWDVELKTQTMAERVAGHKASNSGKVQKGASASTNPHDCKVAMPSAKKIAKDCTPAIVLKAWRAHEDTHAALCSKINKLPVKAWDGKTPLTLGDPLAQFDGFSLPISAFAAYTELPSQKSADEVAAYKAEIAIYKPWLKRHCDS